GTALPVQNLQLVFGNTYNQENGAKLGIILAATYRNSATISEQIRNDFNDMQVGDKRGIDFFGYNDKYYNFNTALGVMANFAYTKGSSKFALKNNLNQN